MAATTRQRMTDYCKNLTTDQLQRAERDALAARRAATWGSDRWRALNITWLALQAELIRRATDNRGRPPCSPRSHPR